MNILLGLMFILWGVLILYSSLWRMKSKEDYKDHTTFNSSGYIEWESLFKLVNMMPYRLAKSFVLVIGTSFVVLGAWMI